MLFLYACPDVSEHFFSVYKNMVHVPIWGVTVLFSVESKLLPEMDT